MTSRRLRRPDERIRRVRYVIIGAGSGRWLPRRLPYGERPQRRACRAGQSLRGDPRPRPPLRDPRRRRNLDDSSCQRSRRRKHHRRRRRAPRSKEPGHRGRARPRLVGNTPIDTPIVCLQNGVENERVALRRFAHVYGGMVIVPATYLSPGTVSVGASPTLGICDVGRVSRWRRRDHEGPRRGARCVALVVRSGPRHHALQVRQAAREPLQCAADRARARPREGATSGTIVRNEGVACLEAAGIDYASSAELRERRARVPRRARPASGRATQRNIHLAKRCSRHRKRRDRLLER